MSTTPTQSHPVSSLRSPLPISPRSDRSRRTQHIRAPSNISRLQPKTQSESLSTGDKRTSRAPDPPAGAGARSGLRPLGMSSLNTSPDAPGLPSTSPQAPQLPRPLQLDSKADRRRSMICPGTAATSPPPSEDEPAPTTNKLKRLSLVARPPSLELPTDRPSSPRMSASPELSGDSHLPSTPAPTRRPSRRMGIRASISYSPAAPVTTPRPEARRPYTTGWSSDLEEGYELDITKEAGETVTPLNDRPSLARASTQTLTEKHADLLTHIAQRERRVNELRQELLRQEASLNTLKSHWSEIVSKSALSPQRDVSIVTDDRAPSRPNHETTRRARPVSMISTLTSGSSASSVSLATIDEPILPLSVGALIPPAVGLGQTGAAVLNGIMAQTEGYLGPEVVQGGRRFLGTLWKTVGAAAGGTVPSDAHDPSEAQRRWNEDRRQGDVEEVHEEGDWTQFGPKLDLSNIQRMITPWTVGLQGQPSHPLSSRTPDEPQYARRERKPLTKERPRCPPANDRSDFYDQVLVDQEDTCCRKTLPVLISSAPEPNLPESDGFHLLPSEPSHPADDPADRRRALVHTSRGLADTDKALDLVKGDQGDSGWGW
ncbi:hypothetical protein IAU60_001890 [Kwoniella sp. DSM 27419]